MSFAIDSAFWDACYVSWLIVSMLICKWVCGAELPSAQNARPEEKVLWTKEREQQLAAMEQYVVLMDLNMLSSAEMS